MQHEFLGIGKEIKVFYLNFQFLNETVNINVLLQLPSLQTRIGRIVYSDNYRINTFNRELYTFSQFHRVACAVSHFMTSSIQFKLKFTIDFLLEQIRITKEKLCAAVRSQ